MSAGYEESELLSGFQAHFEQFSTQALHITQEPEQWTSMAMVPSISLSNNSKQSTSGQHAGFNYCCSANLTQNCLEKAVAAIDGAKYSLSFASGSAAMMTIVHLLKSGDNIICMKGVHGGANQYFCRVASEMGVETLFVDCTSMKSLNAAIKPNTKLVWIETPTNPMMKVIDIKACAETAHKHGDIILVVDNTFMTSYFQRPLALGADICMCSATKYMNAIGAIPSPFDCYMCNCGLKTFALRMKQHFRNALAVAKFLEADPRVDKVIFPGLPSHPQHDLIKQQCTGSSGMMAFLIKGGLENAKTFLKNLKLFTLAESLGGYGSLAEHSATMSHSSVPKEERDALGISDTLIRLSIGLEDSVDIIEDLHQALKAAHPNAIKPAEQINL
ncbi:cystathionine gamma-lyase-like isoform X2 [Stegostoma tigrinum]|uniref:cystathionine gamma-lyase-like isoform X2 n=1 Tax=Stegostoma tigrinum TaxID=3053191 RepID=UPI00202B2ACF|nr:cystathionine gamma-lyase-like isoform X2 [Stegostoma tigrinum]